MNWWLPPMQFWRLALPNQERRNASQPVAPQLNRTPDPAGSEEPARQLEKFVHLEWSFSSNRVQGVRAARHGLAATKLIRTGASWASRRRGEATCSPTRRGAECPGNREPVYFPAGVAFREGDGLRRCQPDFLARKRRLLPNPAPGLSPRCDATVSRSSLTLSYPAGGR